MRKNPDGNKFGEKGVCVYKVTIALFDANIWEGVCFLFPQSKYTPSVKKRDDRCWKERVKKSKYYSDS
jgi:hypothetical protein